MRPVEVDSADVMNDLWLEEVAPELVVLTLAEGTRAGAVVDGPSLSFWSFC